MSLANAISHIPIIYDIPVDRLWIPAAFALGSYLFPLFMNKVFPLQQDGLPLAGVRHQIAQVHYGSIRILQPRFFRFIHVDVRDNLHISVFLIAMFVLKKPYTELNKEYIVLAILTASMCMALTLTRQMTADALSSISNHLPRNNGLMEKIASIFTRTSLLIAPTQLVT